MSSDRKTPTKAGQTSPDVQDFLNKVAAVKTPTASGEAARLLFAIDATASREPTWDAAMHTQAEMFKAASDLGGLSVQLAFYRGFGEFKVSPWLNEGSTLLSMMTSVFCMAGKTQIDKVLKHAKNETRKGKVQAVIFVGDVVEENVDTLGHLAGELGLVGVPVFVFQEGFDPIAEMAFRQIATLSGGAYARFDAHSPEALRQLLSAVAIFAAGGRRALENHAKAQGGDILMLADQMKR